MLVTLSAAALLWGVSRIDLPMPPQAVPERLMTLVLQAAPEPLHATPPAPAPSRQAPRPQAQAALPAPAPPPVSHAPAQPTTQTLAAPAAAGTGSTHNTTPSPEAAVRAPAPATAAPAAAAAPSPPAVEAGYVSQLRALLDAAKRYPTGREASLRRPQGKVVVWFVLTRAGALQDAGIEQGSEFHLLDQAALSTVRRTTFPPMPPAAWPAAGTQRFTATLDFMPPG